MFHCIWSIKSCIISIYQFRKKNSVSIIILTDNIYEDTIPQYIENLNFAESKILNEIEIILPEFDNKNITKDFINAFELSIYKKNIKNIQLKINRYTNKSELDNIIKTI